VECLVLFAKAPAAERVKTRLVPPLTPAQAASLHAAMLADQIELLRALRSDTREIAMWLDAPWHPESPLAEALEGIPRGLQGDGDLGVRMARALAAAFSEGAAAAAILAGDAPTLPASRVLEAFGHLAAGADAVLVPALDGGYVLVGTREPRPSLFEGISWGSPTVAAETRARAESQGLRLAQTAAWGDVDAPGDLSRLIREIADAPERAPFTAAAIEDWRMDFGESPVL
jgi:uncharacterized protein